MYDRVKSYVDGLFSGVESCQETRDLHDEILQNTYERYNEELALGKSEREAYAAAIEAVGDTRELLAPYGVRSSDRSGLKAAAISLYVMSIVPLTVISALPAVPNSLGIGTMFLMAAIATVMVALSVKGRITGARVLRAVGCGLFVIAAAPLIVLKDLVNEPWGEALGLGIMFGFAALGCGLLILGSAKDSALMKDKVGARGTGSPGERVVSITLWCLASFAFLALCAMSHWKFAWLIFPFTGGLTLLMRGAIRMICGKIGGVELALKAAIMLSATSVYWDLVQEYQMWLAGGLVFGIAGCLCCVTNGIFTLGRGGKAI